QRAPVLLKRSDLRRDGLSVVAKHRLIIDVEFRCDAAQEEERAAITRRRVVLVGHAARPDAETDDVPALCEGRVVLQLEVLASVELVSDLIAAGHECIRDVDGWNLIA